MNKYFRLKIAHIFLYRFILSHILIIAIISLNSGCKKIITVDAPSDKINNEAVFDSDETAVATIAGIYHEMVNNSGFASGSTNSVTVLAGLSADELVDYTGGVSDHTQLYLNKISDGNTAVFETWRTAYNTIYACNSAIKGLSESLKVTDSLKAQLIGESKFIRAFSYFYLVNLFGKVPLILSTDYRVNAISTRTEIPQIYAQIVEDIEEAITLLPISYIDGKRVRVNKFCAYAMMARVQLFLENWQLAEQYSTYVIDNPEYKLEETLNNVFLVDSKEAIWQLMPVVPSLNTNEGALFILNYDPFFVALSKAFAESFDPNDNRRINWISSYNNGTVEFKYPYKYKINYSSNVTEYSIALRLAEQFLIRAEARAHLENFEGSADDVNRTRLRAGLPDIREEHSELSMEILMSAIEKERKFEMFTEWGHRWMDLIRMGRALNVLVKPDFTENDQLYPIPRQEILNNPNLLPQNQGY